MKIAVVQMDVTLGDVEGNLARVLERLREARAGGAELTILPECAITGYCFTSRDEALPFAQSVPGPATNAVAELLGEIGGHAIFGLLESAGNRLFNAAVLVDGDGLAGAYRKVHLPFLGVDQHVDFGDRPFAVHSAGNVRVGMNICYDSAFPEASRCLSLAGADLIALPTNFPQGAEAMAEFIVNTRAMENAVYFAAANRVGTERGFQFIGQSRIAGPAGNTLAVASADREEILYADIDPQLARSKEIVRRPGEHVINRFADRRPDFYRDVVTPHDLQPPGRTE